MKRSRICLVSPGHVASNPRLVKEADALCAAGYQVRVVAGDSMAAVRPLDDTILATAPWAWVRVGLGSKVTYLSRRFRQELAQRIAQKGWIPNLAIAMWAHNPMSMSLATAAAAEPADLYIAHCLAALPAAAIAAQKHNARLGFDAEDYHTGELADTPKNQVEMSIRDRIERTLLPNCQHLTAASPMIAQAYAKRYGVIMEPILNVFPLSEAPASSAPQPSGRIGTEPSLYWFSQTIGGGRGLEAIVQAMGQMQTRVRFHLRGMPASGYQDKLMQLAKSVGVDDRVHFLLSESPTEMCRLAALHDFGLSIEPGRDINNSICLGNKIFTYLLAGLPVVLSKTPAQVALAQQLGKAAILVDIYSPSDIATTLDTLIADPIRLVQARRVAWKLGQEQFNWDVEQQKFLRSVESVLQAS
jgi:glycosyltransferase involved in cell wall biosynthesis